MWFLKFRHEVPPSSESSAKIKKNNEDGFFAALISPLITDIKEKNIEARTITVKQKGDAQIIIINTNVDVDNQLEVEDAFDGILYFLGNRLDPITAGKEILALDTLVERIFVRRSLSEPIEYPIFDDSGKTSQTAVLKNPVVIVARKGLRALTKNEETKAADKLYIPIRVSMSKELADKLVNSLCMHPAVKLLTKADVLKHIGINPDTRLMEVVISQLVSGYPSPSPDIHDIKIGDMIYVWLEVTDRKYYNKILTQIYEIINDFAIKEMKSDSSDFELEIEVKPAVFMTKMEMGGELCSQILLSGSGCLFTSLQGINKVMPPSGRMNEIASMGIALKPNSDT